MVYFSMNNTEFTTVWHMATYLWATLQIIDKSFWKSTEIKWIKS